MNTMPPANSSTNNDRRSSALLPVLGDSDSTVSRRQFVCASALSLVSAALAACGGSDPTGPGAQGNNPPAGTTTFVNGIVTISLSGVPDLTATNGHVVIGMNDASSHRADLIVVNASGTFRAFSSVCTHEGCTVTGFSGTRMLCPCHGSEYDLTGKPVAGPAPLPLREFQTVLNSGAGTLTISVL